MRKSLLKGIRYIPTLPAILTQILELLNDEHSNAAKLEERIIHDQALSSKVLAVANSAYYGFQHQILTVRRAVVALGFEEIRNICLGASLMGFLHPSTFRDQEAAERLWLHSLVVAEAARIIARESQAASPDTAFTAGLLHDLGKAVLAAFFPQELDDLHTLRKSQGMTYRQAELALEMDHCQLGMILARQWELPPPLRECLGFHHDLDPDLPNLGLSATVHLADIMARSSGIGDSGNPDPPEQIPWVSSKLGLGAGQQAECLHRLEKSQEGIEALWQMLLAG